MYCISRYYFIYVPEAISINQTWLSCDSIDNEIKQGVARVSCFLWLLAVNRTITTHYQHTVESTAIGKIMTVLAELIPEDDLIPWYWRTIFHRYNAISFYGWLILIHHNFKKHQQVYFHVSSRLNHTSLTAKGIWCHLKNTSIVSLDALTVSNYFPEYQASFVNTRFTNPYTLNHAVGGLSH